MIDKQTDMSAAERMGEEIATLAARIDAATYELLVLIRKFDELGNWGCGFLSCAHFLNWRIGLAPGAARERVRIARALGDLPRISAAMKRGELSYSKVRALTRVARPDTEETLLGAARTCTAAHVEQMVRAWRRIDRSVEAADDELRDASSEVTTHVDENGMVVIRGRLAPEAGEVLRKAIEAAGEKLYAPEQKDRPSAGKVRADALVLVAESALRGGLDPGSSGDRYQVVVHVNEAELGTAASGSTNGRRRADRLAGDEAKALQNQAARPATAPDRNGHVPAGAPEKDVSAGTPARPVASEVTEVKALQNQAARPATAPDRNGHVPAGTPEKDVPAGTPAKPVASEVTEVKALQNQAARLATAPACDGHVPAGTPAKDVPAGTPAEPVQPEVLRPVGSMPPPSQASTHATGAGSPRPSPEHGAETAAPQASTRNGRESAGAGLPAADRLATNRAWIGDSNTPVSAETARRIACDAGRVRMTHDSDRILSVGRKTRSVPPPIRRALEFRDQGCRFPGCTSRHCDAHHIVHWADGGETKLSNLVLVCRRHHRLLHEGRFGLRMSEDGAVRFFHRGGRPLEQSPAPPPIGLHAARELVERLENAGILITGGESMPSWDGEPLDLRYAMECLWKPPPHLEELVARERGATRPGQLACRPAAAHSL